MVKKIFGLAAVALMAVGIFTIKTEEVKAVKAKVYWYDTVNGTPGSCPAGGQPCFIGPKEVE